MKNFGGGSRLKGRVIYKFREDTNDLEIWLEDYDALSCFLSGRFDLEIFPVCSSSEFVVRWEKLNAREEMLELAIVNEVSQTRQIQNHSRSSAFHGMTSARWFQILVILAAYHILCTLYRYTTT
jgi:hypothetical protein